MELKGGKEDKNEFTKGQISMIKDICRDALPDEQRKCAAFRIFDKDQNIEKLFEGFTKIDNLIVELKEHKESHKELQEEVNKLKKWKISKTIVTALGSIAGGFGGAHIPK